MSSAVTELARADYAAAISWVLDANDRARRFYALAGRPRRPESSAPRDGDLRVSQPGSRPPVSWDC
jgi:hypothetical protein